MTHPTPPDSVPTFDGMGIAPALRDALDKLGYVTPTPIQRQSIPIAMDGKDVIGIAQTGTGKTLAFGLPMIQRLQAVGGNGLVLLPTRELALQVEETLQKVGKSLGIKTAVLIGGASMNLQKQAIRNRPDIVIATPGRLLDHMQQGTITLRSVKVLVLDEADRMLDMGFAPQIKKVLAEVPAERQTLLFSATMPGEIVQIAAKHMKLPVRVEIAPAGTSAEKIVQEVIMVQKMEKPRLLEKVLTEFLGTVLVFSRTKHGAKKITRALRAMGHTAAEIHANRSQAQRKEALDGFKSGKYRVLVATDIASRGIDVKGIELVLNYDLPENAEDYVHRIGRTARAGHEGHAISFAMPDQRGDLQSIERLIRRELKRRPLPELPPARAVPPESAQDEDRPRSYGQGNSGGRGGSRGGFRSRGGGGGGGGGGGYRR
jgi:ATP-dependent RNA helicase RhlE